MTRLGSKNSGKPLRSSFRPVLVTAADGIEPHAQVIAARYATRLKGAEGAQVAISVTFRSEGHGSLRLKLVFQVAEHPLFKFPTDSGKFIWDDGPFTTHRMMEAKPNFCNGAKASQAHRRSTSQLSPVNLRPQSAIAAKENVGTVASFYITGGGPASSTETAATTGTIVLRIHDQACHQQRSPPKG